MKGTLTGERQGGFERHTEGRRPHGNAGRRDAATSQGTPGAPGAAGGRKELPPEPQRDCGPADHLVLDFGLQNCENKLLVF